MRLTLVSLVLFFLTSCASVPEGVKPVSGFEVDRYLGKWYEIARLDNRFERGLSNITAEYSLNNDGTLKVLNSGFNEKKQRWTQAEGKAKFIGASDVGSLKVSFFGPFYGGYNILDLDKKDYQHVMIAGNDRSYFWILSRTPKMEPAIQQRLINKAKTLGFEVNKLIYVDHSKNVKKVGGVF